MQGMTSSKKTPAKIIMHKISQTYLKWILGRYLINVWPINYKTQIYFEVNSPECSRVFCCCLNESNRYAFYSEIMYRSSHLCYTAKNKALRQNHALLF